VDKLTRLLGLSAESNVAAQMMGFPDRGHAGPMPPVEPLIYRLYEIVQNYGYALKAVMNEKFGDGIMSAICFSSKVEKEVVRFRQPFSLSFEVVACNVWLWLCVCGCLCAGGPIRRRLTYRIEAILWHGRRLFVGMGRSWRHETCY